MQLQEQTVQRKIKYEDDAKGSTNLGKTIRTSLILCSFLTEEKRYKQVHNHFGHILGFVKIYIYLGIMFVLVRVVLMFA